MISGATNKISLYSQPRQFANGFRPGRPACLAPRVRPRPSPHAVEKVPTPGNDFASGAGSGRLSLSFPQVATTVDKERSRVHADRGNFSVGPGSRAVASTCLVRVEVLKAGPPIARF